MRFQTVSAIAAFAAGVVAEQVSYDGWKVFSVVTGTDDSAIVAELELLNTVIEDDHGALDKLLVAVAPEDLEAFAKLGYESSIVEENLGADVAKEQNYGVYTRTKRGDSTLPDLSWFDSYHPYDDHKQFFADLHAAFPNNSEIFSVGESYEGRDIYGFHFWGKDGKDANPIISWHATVHAREWAAAPTVEYLAWQLISGYLDGKAEVERLVNKFDYYIIPFVNPDGFVFTQTTNRFWRKNRQPRTGTTCIGTDGNRNWAYNWHYPDGASDNPCSDTYRGVAAADTPEIAALIKWTEEIKEPHGVKLFIDFHSYGQYALQPYGYSKDSVPTNFDRQVSVARCYADRVFQLYGSRYVYGSSSRELYITTGSAPDWHSGGAGAEFAWTIELRPTGNLGVGGFVLPPEQIILNVEEQWEGLKYVLSVA